MLAYILAIAVGFASLSLYLSAFFLPELHRKDDFLWSGVGLFYALVLWVCAGTITGGVLLGQSAAVSLVLCFGWQTLRLRRAITRPDDQTDVSGFSLLTWVQNRFKKSSPPVAPAVTESQEEAIASPETSQEEVPITSEVETEETPQEEAPITSEVETEETPQEEAPITSEVETEETPQEKTEEIAEDVPASNVSESTESKKKGFSLKSIFGLGKSQSQPSPETPESDLEESNWDDDDDDFSETEEVTPTVGEETEAIVSENVTENPNIKAEETEVKDNPETTESLQEYVAEFETYIADDDAETLIENYQPKTAEFKSEITDKDNKAPEETEKLDDETSKSEEKN